MFSKMKESLGNTRFVPFPSCCSFRITKRKFVTLSTYFQNPSGVETLKECAPSAVKQEHEWRSLGVQAGRGRPTSDDDVVKTWRSRKKPVHLDSVTLVTPIDRMDTL